jgi:hypothetical protein
VDAHLNEQFHVIPGVGNFGDRYFGTETINPYEVDDYEDDDVLENGY